MEKSWSGWAKVEFLDLQGAKLWAGRRAGEVPAGLGVRRSKHDGGWLLSRLISGWTKGCDWSGVVGGLQVPERLGVVLCWQPRTVVCCCWWPLYDGVVDVGALTASTKGASAANLRANGVQF